MTTGRINQIANVTSPGTHHVSVRAPGVRKRDAEAPRSKESFHFLDSNHSQRPASRLAAELRQTLRINRDTGAGLYAPHLHTALRLPSAYPQTPNNASR